LPLNQTNLCGLSCGITIGLGVHVSIAESLDNAVDRAVKRGCDVFQIFSHNPKSWSFNELSPPETSLFAEKLNASGLSLAN
jgi:deoxyribonuclease-4